MGLSLATPWMLLGLGLLSLPVLAHLTGYREVRVVDFPTLRFLEASLLKVRRRRRFEALMLLALRVAVIALLVFLFARPSVTWTASALAGIDPSRPTLVLIDASASMSSEHAGQPVFEKARAEAERLLEGLNEDTLGGLMRFDAQPELLAPGMTAEHGALKRSLQELSRGDGATDLDRALRRAREVLREAGLGSANIFVLTDGTASVLPSDLSEDWPADFVVHYHDLLGEDRENRWVSRIDLRSGERRGEGLQLEAELASVGGGDSVELSLLLPGDLRVVQDVALQGSDAGKARFTLPVPPDGSAPAALELEADGMPADDSFPFTLEGDTTLEVLLVSGDGGANPRDDEVYYLEKALQPGAGSTSRIRPRVVSAEDLRRIDGGPGSVVFLCNVADPKPLLPDLQRFVEAGGGLFVSVGNRVDPDYYNEVFETLLPARFTEVKTRGRGTFETAPVGLSVPPLDEEEFRVFRSGGARAFSRVGFGRVLGTEPRLAEQSRVLLRYSDGLPALLERTRGEGRVVLFTSSLDDDWTDLPLRSIYVSLVHQFARGLSGTLLFDESPMLSVGDRLRLPVPPDPAVRAWVQHPSGRDLRLDPGAADGEGRVLFSETASQGHYALYWASGAGGESSLKARFSVRVPAEESRLARVAPRPLLASVPGLVFHGEGGAVSNEERGQVIRTSSLIPLLLLLLGGCLLGEGLMAGKRS